MSYASHFVSSANTGAVAELSRITDQIQGLLFTENEKDVQVFLFLDDDKQREIATRLSLPASTSFEDHLNRTVKQLPTSGKALDIFKVMLGATGRWRASGDLLSPPPALPLLLLFSNAARAMGEGEDVAGHNYYEHLENRLNTGDKPHLEREYRSHSVELWESFRDWLDAWQDELGICTVVFPEDTDNNNRKYVQMAISQAILRTQERDNLGEMFKIFNLDSSVPIADTLMRAIIEEWLTRSQCSPRLKKMWTRRETHQAIVIGAMAHLAQWTREESGPTRDRISLGVSAQRVPRTGELLLNLDILAKFAPRNPEFEVLDENENWAPLPIFEIESRRFRVGGAQTIGVEALLQEVIEGRLTSRGHVAMGARKPRAVVPLLLHHATREYTESPTIFLNSPLALLVRTDKESRLMPLVTELLNQCALPGWKILSADQRRNLPQHWEFIDGVQLIRPPSQDSLKALPALGIFDVVATSLVSTSGGLKVPGRSPRWLATHPPALVGAFPDEEIDELAVRAQSDESSSAIVRTPVVDGAASVDLASHGLPPGVYSIVVTKPGGKTETKGTIQLVSADSPEVIATLNPRVLASTIGTESMEGFRSASALSDVQALPHLRGIAVYNMESQLPLNRADVPRSLPARGPQPKESAPGSILKLAQRAVPQCAEGGAHHWILEPQPPGKKKEVYLGTCKHCCFVFGFRTKAKPNRIPNILGASAQKPKAPSVPVTTPQTSAIPENAEDWNKAFEALCFLQQGDYKTLTAVCSQVSPSQLSITEFWKNLMSLGHLEVSFDQNQRPARWFVPTPTLNVLSAHRGVFCGRRSRTLSKEVSEHLKSAGYHLSIVASPGFIDYWIAEPEHSDSAQSLEPLEAVLSGVVAGLQVEVDFSTRTLANLAPLSVAQNGLTSIKMFGTDRKWWHHSSRKWISANHDWTAQGSYQTLSFTTSYFFNPTNISQDSVSLLASYDLVKHLSAKLAREPLCAYDPDSKTLSVPLGADLPRLYARAICGTSGVLPVKSTNSELQYQNVSQKLAEHIYWLLSH